MKHLLFIVLALSSLSSFSEVNNHQEEVLLGYSYDSRGIAFQVESSGCTYKKNFSIIVLEVFPPQIVLVRNKRDECEVYALYGTEIKFSYKELGFNSGDEFGITNKIKKSIVID